MEKDDQLQRTEMLLGKEALEKLRRSRVAVFGVGGVGGFAVEALARTGIGALELVDRDVVSLTNLNRQILATHETIGRDKVDVAVERVRAIDPSIRVTGRKCFYLPETADQFDFSGYDYVVDAVDTVKAKIDIIVRATEAGVPVISSMGAGNKLDPTQFRVADIYKTSMDPLAKVLRKELRKRGVKRLKVVYSPEKPLTPGDPGEEPAPGKRTTPGSIAFVPSVAGLVIAGEVVKDLAGIRRR
ncbi:ThiF family adenylyltransferase [Mobilibacterium timonense]|uniref:tRNA threonylcarbamoyladenosine dehydratase n=1 Tax=Mobilibacterium timonense TaxID=1871012 RepID=UPI000986B63D|nr:tRNA threonylcarbamoyladenosine dehydratase [Mobilibacterium timonense]MBM6990347.1 tRNA threonylcarbamoyladenosine dehydratase [Mobilibacterium timonense]